MFGTVRLVKRLLADGAAFRAFLGTAAQTYDERLPTECPCCGHVGLFRPEPHLAMAESCPGCGALERQRLLALAVASGFVTLADCDVLHFAPDPAIVALAERGGARSHVTADHAAGRAELRVDIESLALPDASFDRVICSHVLEHVDDRRALAELHRVLRPRGQAVLMVPIVEGWERTYENSAVTDAPGRVRHFGQWDHVRWFGRDLRDRIRAAGFDLREFTASGEDAARYRLLRGEKVFLAIKS